MTGLRRDRAPLLNRMYRTLALFTDLACLAGAFVPAMMIRFGTLAAYPPSAYIGTWSFYGLWLLVFSTVENLYSFRTSMNRTMYAYRMIRLVLVTTALLVLTVFLLKTTRGLFFDSRIVIILHMFIWMVTAILARTLLLPLVFRRFHRLFRNTGARALVIGPPGVTGKISSLLRRAPIYRDTHSVTTIEEDLPKSPEAVRDLCVRTCEERRCDQIYLLFGNRDLNVVAETSILLHQAGIPFVIFSKDILNLGYFDPWLSLEDYGAVSFLKRSRAKKNDLPARLIDIVAGSLSLLVLSPLLLLTAALVKLTSPGPVFFRQTRVGLNCREFQFLKFRSMKHDSSGKNSRRHKDYFAEYARGVTTGKPDSFKLDQKGSITPIGRLIRKTSIDELPQLFNVLKGDMTLVGPRPCIPYELEHYRDWQKRRFTVKPGLTGIWQVYGRSRLPFDHSQFLDFLYTIDMSYSLDFRLAVKTIPVILMGKGGI